jgi:glycine/D-amino acid oxidase-like deaminating enzyme
MGTKALQPPATGRAPAPAGHAFVLGSGIAGLSLGEILSRNGWRITLLDSMHDLGGDASRCTQDWLHTGWLYAALPYESAMMGCHDSLLLFRRVYGHVLPPEILNVEVDEHGVRYPSSAPGWFKAEYVHYLYSITGHELSYWQKVTWHHYLDWMPLRRLRHLGYSTEPEDDLPPRLVALMNRWENDERGYEQYRVIRSTDARIDTHRVLGSLLALLGERTEVITDARYRLEEQDGRTVIHMNGETHRPDLLIMAAGKSLPALLTDLGHEPTARRLKSVRSPIVVLKRALDLPNFIRFTPHLPDTVNHIKYPIEGMGDVSTIGSYDYCPADQSPDVAPFIARACERLNISQDEVAGAYYGTKTELTGELKRSYNHALERVNDNTLFAVAGKFSQFSALVKELADELGLSVDIGNDARGQLHLEVGNTAPERIARALAAHSLSAH